MVLALESLLLVDGDRMDLSVLAEILVAAQGVLFGYVGGKAYYVQRVALKDTNLAEFLLEPLLLRRITLLFPTTYYELLTLVTSDALWLGRGVNRVSISPLGLLASLRLNLERVLCLLSRDFSLAFVLSLLGLLTCLIDRYGASCHVYCY